MMNKNPVLPLGPSAAACIEAYLDSFPLSRDLRQARLAAVRELQSATGEELDASLPSVLDKAFKGKL